MDPAYRDLHERGAKLRARVLGDDYVSRHAESATTFGGGYQDVASALAWGGIWGRDGLALRDRSMLTLAVLTALGRSEELRAHIAGAIRNGVTREEIEETFIHVGLYAGFPTAVAANRVAQQVFADTDPERTGTTTKE